MELHTSYPKASRERSERVKQLTELTAAPPARLLPNRVAPPAFALSAQFTVFFDIWAINLHVNDFDGNYGGVILHYAPCCVSYEYIYPRDVRNDEIYY